MATIVDNSTPVEFRFTIGPSTIAPEYAGQTFVAQDDYLDSLTFYIGNGETTARTMFYRVLVTTVTTSADGTHPGSVVYESATLQAPLLPSATLTETTVDVGHPELEVGQSYAFIIDTRVANTSTNIGKFLLGMSYWSPESLGSDFASGHIIAQEANFSGTRATDFADNWEDYNGTDGVPASAQADLQFRLSFTSNEAPTNIVVSKTSVQEFRANGTVVGNLFATDADTGDTFTYALTNSAGGRFAIVDDQLRVANGLLLDREQAPSHTIGVRVTDSDGNSYTKSFTIAVSDVNPEQITGNSSPNTLKGGFAGDAFNGSAGNDKLYGQGGNDTLIGGTGNDTLIGGTGRDVMTGGPGSDDFDFNFITETGKTATTRDIIRDFEHLRDDIDLRSIDANGSAAGDPAFKFLAAKGAAFTGVKGQLKWSQVNSSNNTLDKTIIEGDINGDKKVDFQIELTGLKTITSGDFILYLSDLWFVKAARKAAAAVCQF